MKSIRTKLVVVFSASIIIIASVLLAVSIWGINTMNERDSNQLLEHLGRENVNVIDSWLRDLEHSVNNVYYYAYDQLEAYFGKLYGESFRRDYLDRINSLALSEAKGTDNVKAVYYRLTTDIKQSPTGFYYQWDEEAKGFKKQKDIDLTMYEEEDIENVGWYYLPKKSKEAEWIGPYHSDRLGLRVATYATPIYVYGRFSSVVAMDVDIDAMCSELEKITIYNTGSAVLFDVEENLLYDKDHEKGLSKEKFSKNENALSKAKNTSLKTKHPVEYHSSSGTMKLFACKLVNGMTLCVTAPLSEINSTRTSVLGYSITFSIVFAIVALIVMFVFINRFLRPLRELTETSKQLADGNMDVHLNYKGNDEIGQLTETFGLMATSLKRYFDHFHSLAYTDSLTGLNNKAAFTMTKEVIESEVKMGRASFIIVVMDVNNLKIINDSIGHEKGDLLLKHVTLCMRKTFIGFPLYRIGGDEFCSIVNNTEPQDLIDRLQNVTAQMSRDDFEMFQCSYQIAAGAATYVKGQDQSFDDVFNRADQAMYENKKYLKARDKKKIYDIKKAKEKSKPYQEKSITKM